MDLGTLIQRLGAALLPRRGPIKNFEHEVLAGGGMAGCCDTGLRAVEVRKIVGSVGRARALRDDFGYRRGRAITERHRRVGRALQEGKPLPPLELYKVPGAPGRPARRASEYYVLDGHHRVAMARRLGQEFLDAHVVEYRLAGGAAPVHEAAGAGGHGAVTARAVWQPSEGGRR